MTHQKVSKLRWCFISRAARKLKTTQQFNKNTMNTFSKTIIMTTNHLLWLKLKTNFTDNLYLDQSVGKKSFIEIHFQENSGNGHIWNSESFKIARKSLIFWLKLKSIFYSHLILHMCKLCKKSAVFTDLYFWVRVTGDSQ